MSNKNITIDKSSKSNQRSCQQTLTELWQPKIYQTPIKNVGDQINVDMNQPQNGTDADANVQILLSPKYIPTLTSSSSEVQTIVQQNAAVVERSLQIQVRRQQIKETLKKWVGPSNPSLMKAGQNNKTPPYASSALCNECICYCKGNPHCQYKQRPHCVTTDEQIESECNRREKLFLDSHPPYNNVMEMPLIAKIEGLSDHTITAILQREQTQKDKRNQVNQLMDQDIGKRDANELYNLAKFIHNNFLSLKSRGTIELNQLSIAMESSDKQLCIFKSRQTLIKGIKDLAQIVPDWLELKNVKRKGLFLKRINNEIQLFHVKDILEKYYSLQTIKSKHTLLNNEDDDVVVKDYESSKTLNHMLIVAKLDALSSIQQQNLEQINARFQKQDQKIDQLSKKLKQSSQAFDEIVGACLEQKGLWNISVIRQGRNGNVYKVKNTQNGNWEAVKISTEPTHSLDSEIKFLQNIARISTHNFVTKIQNQFYLGSNQAFSMPYLPQNLHDFTMTVQINANQKRHIIYGILKGVSAGHQLNRPHRDIRMQKILMSSKYVPYVCDWGGNSITQKYMPPEHFYSGTKDGFNKFLADSWSVGLVLFQFMENGKYPFDGEQPPQQPFLLQFSEQTPTMAQRLIKALLEFDIKKREHITNIINDKWFDGISIPNGGKSINFKQLKDDQQLFGKEEKGKQQC